MYTKGERQLYQGIDGEYWFVEISGKPDRLNTVIGKFLKKEDALLDAAAPDMYEALGAALWVLKGVRYSKTDRAKAEAIRAIEQALSKAGGK